MRGVDLRLESELDVAMIEIKTPSTKSAAGQPDLARRRLFKAAVKGAAVGAPLIVTLKGGNAWATSMTCLTREGFGGAPIGTPTGPAPLVGPTASCLVSIGA